jgi:eukaryotic-like serine/threonine-protein kinase
VLFDAEGRAKIADFGIARLVATDTLTDDGTVLGTAGYISPEQAAGEPATPASDVYSFGVILFRLLTGRLPFEGESALEVAAMHRDLQAPAGRRGRSRQDSSSGTTSTLHHAKRPKPTTAAEQAQSTPAPSTTQSTTEASTPTTATTTEPTTIGVTTTLPIPP